MTQFASLYSDEEFVEQRTRELDYIIPHIEAWQETDEIREGDPEILAATIDSTAVLALYREEIGTDIYPTVRDMLIETVATGLTTKEHESRERQH